MLEIGSGFGVHVLVAAVERLGRRSLTSVGF